MCLESLERFNVPEIEGWRGYDKEISASPTESNHLIKEA